MTPHYIKEELDYYQDDGTMPGRIEELSEAVIGRHIVTAQWEQIEHKWRGTQDAFVITLDDGTRVQLVDSVDCCAYTELRSFLLHPEKVEHMIMGVGTTDGYTKWHIFADFGDVLELTVSWSAGNVGYYTYGFDLTVVPA